MTTEEFEKWKKELPEFVTVFINGNYQEAWQPYFKTKKGKFFSPSGKNARVIYKNIDTYIETGEIIPYVEGEFYLHEFIKFQKEDIPIYYYKLFRVLNGMRTRVMDGSYYDSCSSKDGYELILKKLTEEELKNK